jgi:hypothetical protein
MHSQLTVVHTDTSHWQFMMANMSRLGIWSLFSLKKIIQAYKFGNTEQPTHIGTVHWQFTVAIRSRSETCYCFHWRNYSGVSVWRQFKTNPGAHTQYTVTVYSVDYE